MCSGPKLFTVEALIEGLSFLSPTNALELMQEFDRIDKALKAKVGEIVEDTLDVSASDEAQAIRKLMEVGYSETESLAEECHTVVIASVAAILWHLQATAFTAFRDAAAEGHVRPKLAMEFDRAVCNMFREVFDDFEENGVPEMFEANQRDKAEDPVVILGQGDSRISWPSDPTTSPFED